MSKPNRRERLREHLVLNGLRNTLAREDILSAIESIADISQESEGDYLKHFNADDVYREIRNMGSPVSLASIYRALPLFSEANIIREAAKRNGKVIYEVVTTDQLHHDHLVCVECGKIIEFTDDELEALQTTICERFHFRQLDHRHCIRGICETCEKKSESQKL